jgi:4-amino-4-deoxy-L-arabinose transferase-like glycosyltransferase
VLVPAALTAALFAGLILWQLLIPRPYFTGTNSIGTGSVVAGVGEGQELCIPQLNLPRGTSGVRLALFSPTVPVIRAAVSVSSAGRTAVTTASAPVSANRANLDAYFPSPPPVPSGAASVPVKVCVAPLNGPVGVGGTANLQYGQEPATLRSRQMLAAHTLARGHGRPAPGAQLGNRVSVWFLPPAGSERSLLASMGSIFSRAALFRPGFVGAWTYPVLLFALLPATWLLSLLLLVRGASGRPLTIRGRQLRTGLAIWLIAFLNAGSWALITPAFQAPDEPDHFGYVQYLAETGHEPSKTPTSQASFSTQQVLGLVAVDTYSTISNSEARPPWLKSDEARAAQLRREVGPLRTNNGGGYTPGASAHDAPYYALGALGYLLVKGDSVFSQLWAVRLVSALLGAIVAACAFGVVRELLPRWRVAAIAAGLLVAYHPMFSFISGAVNDDSGVNAAAAVSLYLIVRSLRRGMTWREALGLAIALALAPLMKETGYEIYPAVAVGLLGVAWRQLRPGARASGAGSASEPAGDAAPAPVPAGVPADGHTDTGAGAPPPAAPASLLNRLRPWAALAAGFVAVIAVWRLIKPHVLDAYAGHAAAGGGVSATGTISAAEHMPGRFLVYLWELFLPTLSFMGRLFPPGWPFFQIYIERGWAAFGWYTFGFSHWVYVVIVWAMVAVGLLALRAAWLYRRHVRRLGWELAVIILFPLCTLVAVEAAFFTPTGGRVVVAEQGRYIFPAIAALAVIAVGGTFGLRKRWEVPLATVLVVAMIGLCFASQLLTLGSFYT